MLTIDKETLRLLNAATGKLDTDTGFVFAGFVGALNAQDSLYHGELRYEDVGTDPPEATVSIESILAPTLEDNQVED